MKVLRRGPVAGAPAKAAALIFAGLAASSLLLAACGGGGDDPIPTVTPKGMGSNAAKPAAAPAGGAPAPAAQAAGADGGTADGLPALPLREFQEGDFAETDRSRDPFRSFEHLFMNQAKGRVNLQRQVLIDRYSLEELKLVGVVTRGAARALLIDPSNLGWVGKVGDFIGKAELVHSGGPTGTDVAINWRIDRIRDTDIVLVREDPSHPEIPPTTRVIALYPLNESTSQGPQGNR
jgi:type IV pilus assembly protein PilP